MEIQESDWPEKKSPRGSKLWEKLVIELNELKRADGVYDAPFKLIDGYYFYQQAAREIADNQGWNDEGLEALEALMARAINSGKLPRRGRKTGEVISPDSSELFALVTVEDVNLWLEQEVRAPYRWTLQGNTPQPQTATPAPVVRDQAETKEQRQARRYQQGIDAGLVMPTNDYTPMPRGIGDLAKKEKPKSITRQSYVQDVKAHINRTFTH